MARRLTKVDRNGTPYTRPAEIEAEVDTAVAQSTATLAERAALGRFSPGYLRSEVLLHVIRDARRRNGRALNDLVPLLLRRCSFRIKSKTDDTHVLDEVLGRLVEMIASDGHGVNPNQLDFFEVKFNQALRALRLGIQQREKSRRGVVELPAEPIAQPGFDDESMTRSWSDGSLADCETPARGEQLLKAIRALPDHVREAVTLVRQLGYKIESTDRNEATAATICGVAGRTIRNRLAEGATLLKNFKEET